MGRKITVHIDSDDLADMLFDRVREWDEQIPWGARDLWYDFYAERVADGYYDNTILHSAEMNLFPNTVSILMMKPLWKNSEKNTKYLQTVIILS